MSTTTPDTPAARDPRFEGVRLVLAMLALMWVVEIIDQIDNNRLESHGIRPHHLAGLQGIVFAPFLHAGWDHLISNTVPFLLLGATIALSGAARVLTVTVIVAVVGGLGVWLVAPSNSLHIGASGLVFGFAFYLISRGLFERSLVHLGVGAAVAAVYGGALLSSLAPRDGISWQGHLFGGIGGVLAAWLLAERDAKPAASQAAT